MTVYRCEDSLEGIFTGIYRAYEDRKKPEDTMLSLEEDILLFAEYVSAGRDPERAEKVIRTLRRRFGEEDYLNICLALSSPDLKKAQAVYRTIAAGISGNCIKGRLFHNLADSWIHKAFSLARAAANENQHLRGFVRFRELEGGILFSEIAPKNHLLPFLMPHFADRFPEENFMLLDCGRGIFGVHQANSQWYMVREERELKALNALKLSEAEREYQELFRHFCHKIAVRERENRRLQQNLLPLRFQEYMVEFE